jgi:hypothetical protein
MGILGLETFIKKKLNSEKDFMRTKKLNEIKFVIDGNQLQYVISEEISNNKYGGNYDEYYAKAHEILEKLKPFIALIIFDGYFIYNYLF